MKKIIEYPDEIHKGLLLLAATQGLSLTRYISDILVERVGKADIKKVSDVSPVDIIKERRGLSSNAEKSKSKAVEEDLGYIVTKVGGDVTKAEAESGKNGKEWVKDVVIPNLYCNGTFFKTTKILKGMDANQYFSSLSLAGSYLED